MAEINENAEVNESENNEEVVASATNAKSEKVKKQKNAPKKPNFFVRAGKRIAKFFRDTMSELKKVVWTPKNELRKSTIIVVVAVVVFAAVIGVIDAAGASLVELLAGLIK